MGYEVLKETPLSVEKMSNLDGIILAVAPEYENASLFLGGLENLNDFDSCTGVWLDRLGQLVCLTRQQAGAMIGSRELADDDNIYRVCLKYKALSIPADARRMKSSKQPKLFSVQHRWFIVNDETRRQQSFFRFQHRFPIWSCLF